MQRLRKPTDKRICKLINSFDLCLKYKRADEKPALKVPFHVPGSAESQYITRKSSSSSPSSDDSRMIIHHTPSRPDYRRFCPLRHRFLSSFFFHVCHVIRSTDNRCNLYQNRNYYYDTIICSNSQYANISF